VRDKCGTQPYFTFVKDIGKCIGAFQLQQKFDCAIVLLLCSAGRSRS
jgi:hypothetical protein